MAANNQKVHFEDRSFERVAQSAAGRLARYLPPRLPPRVDRSLGAVLLARYLEDHTLRLRVLGEQLGISRAQVGMYLVGRSRPSLEMAVRIDEYTSGQVPPVAWTQSAPITCWAALCGLTYEAVEQRRTWFTKDPLRVTCLACQKHERCRVPMLLLAPAVRAHVAVLLDWVSDHPGAVQPGDAAVGSPVCALLADLTRWGFPVDLLLTTPKRVLRQLTTAQARVTKLGQARCNEVLRDFLPIWRTGIREEFGVA